MHSFTPFLMLTTYKLYWSWIHYWSLPVIVTGISHASFSCWRKYQDCLSSRMSVFFYESLKCQIFRNSYRFWDQTAQNMVRAERVSCKDVQPELRGSKCLVMFASFSNLQLRLLKAVSLSPASHFTFGSNFAPLYTAEFGFPSTISTSFFVFLYLEM